MILPFSFDLDTTIDEIFNLSNPKIIDLEAPPDPNNIAFLCVLFKIGLIDLIKPI